MKKVLIIEDDAYAANLYRSRLSPNYEVDVVADGQSGFYAIHETKPDAVVLDTTIPQMDAVTLVGKIRAQKQFRKLPILILVDDYTSDVGHEAMAAGATAGFSKADPNTLSHVLATLSEVLLPFFAKPLDGPASIVPAQGRLPVSANGPALMGRSGSPELAHSGSPVAATVAPPSPQGYYQPEPPRAAPVDHEGPSDLVPLFFESFGSKARTARKSFVAYTVAKTPEARFAAFEQFRKAVSSLRADAEQCEMRGLSRFLKPIEARAKQVEGDLESLGVSSRQNLAHAADLLAALDKNVSELPSLNHFAPTALVVDDENVSRRAICLGLEKVQIRTTAVDNPESARLEAEGQPFDIIFLDVELPGINGFALCARIRTIASHKKTPVVFVSSLDDLRVRASSRVSGGNHFVTKPVNYHDLGIIAFTQLFKQRLGL